ncbi:hypothetical protein [Pseudomonas sp. MWU12-2037]|uniref:hypothetical protein n=1 Tax=Pseudomonas sp. MWU12-2037 TaxID=2928690 RepID=UPI00200CC4D9|nr:hypothetical protein [Pseudomonas sp. MWU12-2037]
MAHSYRIKLPENKVSKGASVKEITLGDSINRGDLLILDALPDFTFIVVQKIFREKDDLTYTVDLETDVYTP